mmetsp:Transcript_13401/g.23994  ORF Transcript_13401/g.23994 Transcript_13401/m.23994 type:complete len:158 (+) Transcript_13401:128-601(+)
MNAKAHQRMAQNVWNLTKFGSMLYVVNTYIFEVTMCVGPSMLPTFSTAGDIVLVENLTPRFGTVKKGDIVISQSPTNPKQSVCKRIKGMGGDTITMAKRYGFDKKKKVTVPKGMVWLEGDNPENSTDSRTYGPVPQAMIRGKVFFKVWPLTEAGVVR